jgi:hypothetical protein
LRDPDVFDHAAGSSIVVRVLYARGGCNGNFVVVLPLLADIAPTVVSVLHLIENAGAVGIAARGAEAERLASEGRMNGNDKKTATNARERLWPFVTCDQYIRPARSVNDFFCDRCGPGQMAHLPHTTHWMG